MLRESPIWAHCQVAWPRYRSHHASYRHLVGKGVENFCISEANLVQRVFGCVVRFLVYECARFPAK